MRENWLTVPRSTAPALFAPESSYSKPRLGYDVKASRLRRMKTAFRLHWALLGMLAAGPLHGADLKAGLAAYNRADYRTAVNEFRPLAETGIPIAQYSMGKLCEEGRGVPQDLHGGRELVPQSC